jgi:hypothetical protein
MESNIILMGNLVQTVGQDGSHKFVSILHFTVDGGICILYFVDYHRSYLGKYLIINFTIIC